MAGDTKMITDNFIYFYHLDKFCILPMYPEEIQESMPSNFAQTTALARTAPVFSYKDSGPRTVSVNLELHRDLMNDLNTNISNLKANVVDVAEYDYVDTLVKYLQAAALPRYQEYNQGSNSVIPPMVAVKFGTGVFVKGVVNSGVTVVYGKPIMSDGKYAKVRISFSVAECEPYDADKVVADGSFRGISRTFKDGVFRSNSKGSTALTRRGRNSAYNSAERIVQEEIDKSRRIKR